MSHQLVKKDVCIQCSVSSMESMHAVCNTAHATYFHRDPLELDRSLLALACLGGGGDPDLDRDRDRE